MSKTLGVCKQALQSTVTFSVVKSVRSCFKHYKQKKRNFMFGEHSFQKKIKSSSEYE